MNIYTVILYITSLFACTAWRWLVDKAEKCSCWSQKYMVCSTLIWIGIYQIINTRTEGCIPLYFTNVSVWFGVARWLW